MTCDMDIQNIYNSIAELSREIVRECTARSVKISTAESCTGGMISGAVTSVSGSSAVIELGVCSYSNRIKHEILHVPAEVLEQFTEYSVECAAEMAKGVMELSGADYFFMVYAYGHDFYAKLVDEIGAGAFYEGLKTYYNANYMGIGTKEKLIAAFSEAAGRDLTEWFEANIAPEAAQ